MKPICRPLLYNINTVIVRSREDIEEYIRFSRWLNRYLQEKYGEYYIGLQLYQNEVSRREFTVIASYQERVGVDEAAILIGREINEIYNKRWGCDIRRETVLSFIRSIRRIPEEIF